MAFAVTVERMVEEYMRRLRTNTTTTDEATERITEIFDTTQPSDSTTGTPPLLSRITERSTAKSRSESLEHTEAIATDSTKASNSTAVTFTDDDDISSETESHEETETKCHEKSREPWWLAGLKILGFLSVAGFVLWLLHTVGTALRHFSNNN